MNKTLDYLRKILSNNSCIVVGTSGGPDSMCLLHLLCDLKEELNLKIIVAHMNHKVREEADIEAEYVKKFALENNLIFEYFELKEKIDSNFHSKSRIIRYKFFDELIDKYDAKFLMTAHHGDDLIETILMRIQRGSNLKGYSGFDLLTKKDKYSVVKPLIFYSKKEIQEYMDNNNYKYYIDKTNKSDDYLRNRYRNHILPILHNENIDIQDKYFKYSNTILEADNFINNYVNKVIPRVFDGTTLLIDEFNKEEDIIKNRLLEYLLSLIYIDDLYLVDDNVKEEIIKTIYSKKPNVSIKLPNNHLLTKEYNKLFVDKEEVINNYKIDNLYYEDENIIIKEVEDSSDNSNNTIRLNTKELSMPLTFRFRKDGDKIHIKNSIGQRKIKDIFIDLKIPKENRNNIILLVDNNNEVIWIPSYKKSKYAKDIKEDYDLILSLERKN